MSINSTLWSDVIADASGSSYDHTGFTFEGDPDVLVAFVANTGDTNGWAEFSSLTFDPAGANISGTELVQEQWVAQNSAWYRFDKPGGGWPDDTGGLLFRAAIDTEARGAAIIVYEVSDFDSILTTFSDGETNNNAPSWSTSSVEVGDILILGLCNRFENDLSTSDTEDLDSSTTMNSGRVHVLRETASSTSATLTGTYNTDDRSDNRVAMAGIVIRLEADPLSAPSVPTSLACTAGEELNTITWSHDESTSSFLVRYTVDGGTFIVPFAEPAAGSISVVHRGLSSSLTYQYSIQAVGDEVNHTGESAWSSFTSGCQPSAAAGSSGPPVGTLTLCGCGK